jgi:16S rRNA (adenine(1408)-N(1))-methyltransferase
VAGAYGRVIVDVGAGDGGYALRRARSSTGVFAIAIDASADALADGAWRAKRHGLENAAFLVEGLERLPAELCALADEVAVHFPWGSLLRGILAADPAILLPLAMLLRPQAQLRILLSATSRDGYGDVTPARMAALAGAYAEHGLQLVTVGAALPEDVGESQSSWAKRLRVGRERSAVIARYRRRDPR